MSSTVLRKVMTAYKKYLIELDYPLINEMPDNDILKIFGKENRVFLLSFLVCKLIPNYKSQLTQKSSNIENVLANIVYGNGFCKDTEKLMITTQGIDADTEKQIVIFNKIFTYLSLLQRDVCDKENFTKEQHDMKDLFTSLTAEQIEKHILKDVKLFTSFAEYKPLCMAERDAKFKYYREEIEKLKKMSDALNIKTDTEDINENAQCVNAEELNALLFKLKESTIRFNENFSDFSSKTKKMQNGLRDNHVEECITNTSKNLNNVLEVISNKNSLQDIPQVPITECETVHDEDSDFISKNYAISERIIEDFNNSRTD